jgi:hypothetical protein
MLHPDQRYSPRPTRIAGRARRRIKGAAGIKLSAEVRSCQPRVRIGFRFITMDDEMRNKLSKLIATMEQSHP